MKVKTITENRIVFDDGTVVTDHHDQDCCENVYADFASLKHTSISDEDFDDIEIVGVKDSGVKLNGYFIPCYNQQNGYYSSDLAIVIKYPDKVTEKRIDISEFVEDDIC